MFKSKPKNPQEEEKAENDWLEIQFKQFQNNDENLVYKIHLEQLSSSKKKGIPKFVVISNHRFFFLNPGKKIKKDFKIYHLYQLSDISCSSPSSEKFSITFGRSSSPMGVSQSKKDMEKKKSEKKTTYGLQSKDSFEFIKNLRKAVRNITVGFPEELTFTMDVLPERILELEKYYSMSPIQTFLDIYRAQCTFYRVSAAGDIEIILSNAGLSNNLDVVKIAKMAFNAHHKVNFIPIAAALRHFDYFKLISIEGLKSKEVPQLFADTMIHNGFITGLVLRNINGTESAFQALGTALLKHRKNSLSVIDFSHNPEMKDKGLFQISNCLKTFDHPLLHLNVSNCGISKGGLAHLVSMIESNKKLGICLKYLNLSGNHLSDIGSLALEKWLYSIAGQSQMETLILRNTSIQIGISREYSNCWRKLPVHHLDISHNKLDNRSGDAVRELAEFIENIKVLKIQSSTLSKDIISSILYAMLANKKIKEPLELDLSSNNFEFGPSVLERSVNIASLVLDNIKVSSKSLENLFYSIGPNSCLKELSLSSIVIKSSPELDTALLQMIQRSSLKKLSIADTFQKNTIYSLLKVLEPSNTLKSLDIRSSSLGDDGAEWVADLLRFNCSLIELFCDGNGFTVVGWTKILNALKVNTSLATLGFPSKDVNQIGSEWYILMSSIEKNLAQGFLYPKSESEDLTDPPSNRLSFPDFEEEEIQPTSSNNKNTLKVLSQDEDFDFRIPPPLATSDNEDENSKSEEDENLNKKEKKEDIKKEDTKKGVDHTVDSSNEERPAQMMDSSDSESPVDVLSDTDSE